MNNWAALESSLKNVHLDNCICIKLNTIAEVYEYI